MQAGEQIARRAIAGSRELVVEAMRQIRSGDGEVIVICRENGPMVGILIDSEIAVKTLLDELPENTTAIVVGGRHFVVRCY